MLINQPESVTETSNAAAVPTFGNNNCIFDILYRFRSPLESAQLVRPDNATKSIFLHYTHNSKFLILTQLCT